MLLLFSILWNYFMGTESFSSEAFLMLLSLVFWCLFYITLHVQYDASKSAEWCNRVVTLTHGCTSALFGAWMCGRRCMTWESLHAPCRSGQYLLMLSSWGYFSFDLIWCVAYWTEGPLMLLHHVSSILFITRFMHRKTAGCFYCCCISALEITNPCLQIRWFLREANMEKTAQFVLVEAAYLITFILVRGVAGTVVTLQALINDIDVEIKLMAVVLWVVSILFIYDIYKFVQRKLPGRLNILWSENERRRSSQENQRRWSQQYRRTSSQQDLRRQSTSRNRIRHATQ